MRSQTVFFTDPMAATYHRRIDCENLLWAGEQARRRGFAPGPVERLLPAVAEERRLRPCPACSQSTVRSRAA